MCNLLHICERKEMNMKKKLLIIVCVLTVFLTLATVIGKSNEGGDAGEIDVIWSRNTTYQEGAETHIAVVLNNPDYSEDYDETAAIIVGKFLRNDFPSVLFSFDINGYPNEIAIDVYESQKDYESNSMIFTIEGSLDSNEENYAYSISSPLHR